MHLDTNCTGLPVHQDKKMGNRYGGLKIKGEEALGVGLHICSQGEPVPQRLRVIIRRVKQMRGRGLSNYEQETIINFNKEEAVAHIFTYEKTWQQHLEKRLGLKPTMDNGFGGKGYEIDKKRIRPPRAPVRLSAEARAKLADRLHQSRDSASQSARKQAKSDKKNQNKGNTINRQPRLLGE